MAGTNAQPSQPLVASVVINFRGAADTVNCVRSLLATTYANHRIIVVENGSGAGEAARLEGDLGGSVELVRLERNLGYGGGANAGIRAAVDSGAEYVWILNNDTIADPNCVASLVAAMTSDPEYGAVSPWISAPVGPEAPFGVWYGGGYASLGRAVAKHVVTATPRQHGVVETGFISGCAMFLSISGLRRCGDFWEDLFLYWEDVDLSYRLRQAGLRLGVVTDARLFHAVHGSVRSETASYYFYRNALLVAGRHGGRRLALQAAASLVARVARLWAGAILKRSHPAPLAETKGLAAGLVSIARGIEAVSS